MKHPISFSKSGKKWQAKRGKILGFGLSKKQAVKNLKEK